MRNDSFRITYYEIHPIQILNEYLSKTPCPIKQWHAFLTKAILNRFLLITPCILKGAIIGHKIVDRKNMQDSN